MIDPESHLGFEILPLELLVLLIRSHLGVSELLALGEYAADEGICAGL
jgi:hypothetical protein